MKPRPLISIVVPSYNQGRFIGETLQSLVAQDYPHLEVIIQDGGSTDDSAVIAREFARLHPAIFQVFIEPDSGQADALNRGFARTKGEILGFLNSDDTLFPGCLQRVASEINPARGRHVVFGRCLFTGEGSPYVGVEHPAAFVSHFEQLAIWKRGYNTIPQPSVFWHRTVWKQRGGLNEKEQHVLDYDLFCRFSSKFRFHFVDELWSTYRMHPASKSSQRTEVEILELSIAASRRYWGPWWCPQRWRCEISYGLHQTGRFEHARHHARNTETAWRNHRWIRGFGEFIITILYSPQMAWRRLAVPFLQRHGLHTMQSLLFSESAQDGFTGQYGDSWIGPVFRKTMDIPESADTLVIILEHVIQGNRHHLVISPQLRLNGKKTEKTTIRESKQFYFNVDIKHMRNKQCLIEIIIPEYFIPSLIQSSSDGRKLSAMLHEIKIMPLAPRV